MSIDSFEFAVIHWRHVILPRMQLHFLDTDMPNNEFSHSLDMTAQNTHFFSMILWFHETFTKIKEKL